MTRTIEEWQKYIHEIAVDHGWWEPRCEHTNCIYEDDVPYWCRDCGSLYYGNGNWKLPELAKSRNLGELHMLFVTEIAESFEDIRNNEAPNHYFIDAQGKPQGPAIEIIDELIRLLDYCGKYEIPVEALLELKSAYNETRPYRHGGKLA